LYFDFRKSSRALPHWGVEAASSLAKFKICTPVHKICGCDVVKILQICNSETYVAERV
jgi:hypothetical protein